MRKDKNMSYKVLHGTQNRYLQSVFLCIQVRAVTEKEGVCTTRNQPFGKAGPVSSYNRN